MPEITQNHLQSQVLYVLASAGTAPREALMQLGSSGGYLEKVLLALQAKGLVRLSSGRPTVVHLTRAGEELLSTKCPGYVSSGTRLGGTNAHKELRAKAALAVAVMIAAGVNAGPCKRSFGDVLHNRAPKYAAATDGVFFSHKEFRVFGEKESRHSVSRATGVIIAPHMRGVVYAAPTSIIPNAGAFSLYKRIELEALSRTKLITECVYGMVPVDQRAANILIGSTEAALALLACTNSAKGRWGIGAAVASGMFGADYYWVPDASVLRFVAQHTQDDMLHMAFRDAELEAANIGTISCEAICKGYQCYEFLSSNLSKLWKIRAANTALNNVGIVCWECQKSFVQAFLGEDVHLRVMRNWAY